MLIKDPLDNTIQTLTTTADSAGNWNTAVSSTLAVGDYTLEASDGGAPTTQAMTIVGSTPPTLSTSTPADDATGIALNSNLVLTFNTNVRAGSGFISLYRAGGTLPKRLRARDPLRWPRVGVYHVDDLRRFKAKVSPAVRRLRALRG